VTFSYNLVLALFLLAPGFAFVAAVYAIGRSTIHEATPPPPNSIMALAMVTGGALFAHTLAAIFFLACHGVASVTGWWWPTVDPNPYYLAWRLAGADGLATSTAFAWILGLLTVLCGATYGATRWVMGSRMGRSDLIGAALYGWFWQIEKTRGAYAYVLTQFEGDNGAVGYQGALESVTLDADKQLSSLVLADAELFSIKVDVEGKVVRTATPRADNKLRVLLTRTEIRNIAYTPIVYEDDVAPGEMVDDPAGGAQPSIAVPKSGEQP
jgi:hypothetical protein